MNNNLGFDTQIYVARKIYRSYCYSKKCYKSKIYFLNGFQIHFKRIYITNGTNDIWYCNIGWICNIVISIVVL